jgi:hypothetical protein
VRLSDQVGNVGSKWGGAEALRGGRVPNLPDLPNLRAEFSKRVRVWACARALAGLQINPIKLGRLGRLGKARFNALFRAPNLLPTFLTSPETER